MRKRVMGAALAIVGLLLLASWQGELNSYIRSLNQDGALLSLVAWQPARTPAVDTTEQLRQQIAAEAKKRAIAPVDARVDRVWKAIPGYNGLAVDEAASLARTLELKEGAGEGKLTLVMREVSPQVQLKDLGDYPIYKGNPNKPMVGLMINVAWGNEFLPGMLQTLAEAQVKATFFFDGSWLKKNLELARTIQDQGHELSNHAYSHPSMSRLSRSDAFEQIARTEQLLQDELGVRNRWFAPPSGDFNQMTVEVAAAQGLKTVLWTLDTVDWQKPAPASIIRKVRLRAEPGTLILMHPTASASEALAGLIAALKEMQLMPGTVSEVLSEKRVAAS